LCNYKCLVWKCKLIRAVAGNIAVGKTTLCELLAKELSGGYYMDEDHGINPHLNDFYDYMSKGLPGVNPHAFLM
jgi:deoxyadenosine/deoxycytidine kinase